MLVITRRADDSLYEDQEGMSFFTIGTSDGDITVTVENIKRSEAKVSIVAPDSCSILRGELVLKGE